MRDGPWSTNHCISFAPGLLTTEDLQDGCCCCHPGYHNKMFLAILNLNVAQIPPTHVLAQSDFHSGADKFEDFQDGHLGGHLRYQTRTTILTLYVALMPPIKFGSIPITVWEEMLFEEFQDGHHSSHLGSRNRMN